MKRLKIFSLLILSSFVLSIIAMTDLTRRRYFGGIAALLGVVFIWVTSSFAMNVKVTLLPPTHSFYWHTHCWSDLFWSRVSLATSITTNPSWSPTWTQQPFHSTWYPSSSREVEENTTTRKVQTHTQHDWPIVWRHLNHSLLMMIHFFWWLRILDTSGQEQVNSKREKREKIVL